jgi:putative glycosyltransferase (TIGR04348 family)
LIRPLLAQRDFRGIHPPVKVLIVCPSPARSQHGNRVTALRWSGILRALGHRVRIAERFTRQDCDLLIALHARKSAGSVEAFRRARPEHPIVVTLTGTDLYRDLRRSKRARRALAVARRVVLLQPLGLRELPPPIRRKACVIYQSATHLLKRPRPAQDAFEIAVVGHLRPVKDPMRAALAARRLPASSRIRIVHLGKAMTRALEQRARAENERNPRYRWLGERPRHETLARLARARLLVLPSRMEGGANVISEAAVAGVPVVATRIAGSVGLLGTDYPGYFAPGDTTGLARLLWRAERDPAFYARLAGRCRESARLFEPSRERAAWRRLLTELGS